MRQWQWRLRWHDWQVQVAVAAGYAIGYALFRQVTFSHWSVISGFRLFALLLVPYRFWLALAIGEAIPLGYTAVTCASTWGGLWAVLYTLPPIALGMPVVYWCRERARIFQLDSKVNIGVLLIATVLVSVIWTLTNMGTMAVTRLPVNFPAIHWDEKAARWFIGNFLGILTVTPVLLFGREVWLAPNRDRFWRQLSDSRLALEVVFVLFPILAFLVWLAFGAAGEGARQAARMAMFLPVIFLAMRYGWHGAAVGGTASSIAVVLTMSPQHDLETLQSEIFISFAITAMMLFGARIAHLNAREQKDREGLQVALALAQRNVYLGEMQLQQTSQALERVRESVRSTFSLFLERMRVAAPLFDERTMRRRVVVAQEQLYRLSDTLYPLVWRDHGLPTALREGAIARSLSECGMVYWCDVQRSEELKKLPQVMHITLYRLACEAIGLACAKDGSSSIRLTLRGGSFGPRRWAVLRVDRGCEPHRGENVQREELLMRLPFHGLGVDAMRDRAGAFKGKLRIRKRPAGDRLSIILHEPEGSRQ